MYRRGNKYLYYVKRKKVFQRDKKFLQSFAEEVARDRRVDRHCHLRLSLRFSSEQRVVVKGQNLRVPVLVLDHGPYPVLA